jgi:diguanylate cyclase (GGDEF)-like protein/PAS domain S-box-containing protein
LRSIKFKTLLPDLRRRLTPFRKALFGVLLATAATVSVLLHIDSQAEKKHEQQINRRQFHIVTLVRLAAEDRLTAVKSVSDCLRRDIAQRLSGGSVGEEQISGLMNRALERGQDILGFWFIPGPLAGGAPPVFSLRSTRAAKGAFPFASAAAEAVKTGEVPLEEAAKLSGTHGTGAGGHFLLFAEKMEVPEGLLGAIVAVVDLSSIISRYASLLTRDGESMGAVFHDDGGPVWYGDSHERTGRTGWEDLPQVKAMAGLAGGNLSGMDALNLSVDGEDRRLLVTWNSLRAGADRISLVMASYGEADAGILPFMKLQRDLMTGVFLILVLTGVFLFAGKQKREASEKREAAFRAIFDNAPSGIAVLDRAGKFLSCNQAWEAMAGQSEERLKQRTIAALAVPGCPGAAILEKALLENPESFRSEVKFLRPDGSEFWGSVFLTLMESYPPDHRDVVLALISDISRLKLAEELLRQGTAALESQKEELEKQTSDQGMLLDLFTLFAEADTPRQIYEALHGSLPVILSFRNFVLCISLPGKEDEYILLDSLGETAGAGQSDFGTNKKGIIGHVLSTGKSYVSGDLSLDPLYVPHAKEVKSMAVVPITYKGRVWGVLGMDSSEPYAFSVRERDLLGLVGFYLALHLEEVEIRTELNTKAEQLRSLHSVVQQLAVERVNIKLSRRIADILGDELGYSMAGVFVPDGASPGAILLLEGFPSGSQEWEERVFTSLREAAAEVLDGGGAAEKSPGSPIRTLAVPIAFGNEVFAALAVSSEGGISPSDKDLLEIIAEHGATFWLLNNMLAERRREALIDPLTQVWNRRFLLQRLEEETARLRRTGGIGAVVLVDLGDFKSIHDRFGHLAGDEVLKETAALLNSNLRTCDVIGRFGGDEFLIYLPDISAEQALSAMERMDSLVTELKIPGVEAAVVLDYGVASFPDDGDDLVAAIGDADLRMYEYKAGRKAGR